MRIFCIFTIIITLTTFISVSVSASGEERNFKEKIQMNTQRFETILNEKGEPEVLIDFLHNIISNSAEFHLTVKDASQNKAEDMQYKLDKADYINSYLYGPRQISNYRADIKSVDITLDKKAKTASATDIVVETGVIKNPGDANGYGRDFISRTTCESKYGITDKQAVILKSSTCHTNISYGRNV